MVQLSHQFNAKIQRWLYREQAGWVSRALSEAVRFRAVRRARMFGNEAPATPTIVVGGLSVGGSGKTPMAALLASRLATEYDVALLCRGWSGTATRPRKVHEPAAVLDGDEAAMLRGQLPAEVALWASRDLERGRAIASRHAEVVIIDDGFQTLGLSHTHSIVVVDATAPFRIIPSGPLLEPLTALKRADLVWLHKVDEPTAEPLPEPFQADVKSRYVPQAVRLPDGRRVPPDWLAGKAVTAVCGVGRPESFIHQLETLGADIVDGFVCGDHKSAPPRVIAQLARAGMLITTEKDAVRWPGTNPTAVLEVAVEIVEGEARLWETMRSWLAP